MSVIIRGALAGIGGNNKVKSIQRGVFKEANWGQKEVY